MESEIRYVRAVEPELLTKADELLYHVLWQPFGMPNVRREFHKGGTEAAWTALDKDRVVGCFILVVYENELAELRHAAVLPECQRRDIGRNLWQLVLAFAAAEGIREIEVYARNSAVEFWTGLGFTGQSDWLDHELFKPHGIRFKRMTFAME